MDEDVARALDRITKDHHQMHAALIVLGATVEAMQTAILKFAQKCAVDDLDGVAIQKWISDRAIESVQALLLDLNDEQLAAELHRRIAETKKDQ